MSAEFEGSHPHSKFGLLRKIVIVRAAGFCFPLFCVQNLVGEPPCSTYSCVGTHSTGLAVTLCISGDVAIPIDTATFDSELLDGAQQTLAGYRQPVNSGLVPIGPIDRFGRLADSEFVYLNVRSSPETAPY